MPLHGVKGTKYMIFYRIKTSKIHTQQLTKNDTDYRIKTSKIHTQQLTKNDTDFELLWTSGFGVELRIYGFTWIEP
jgi:hypothetical protein